MTSNEVYELLHKRRLPSIEVTQDGWHHTRYYQAARIGGLERLQKLLAEEAMERLSK